MQVTKSKFTTTRKKPLKQSAEPWTPDAEQLAGVKWLVERSAAALLLDPGAGKTSITYAAAALLKKKKMLHGLLVVAPLRPATQTWPAERDKWLDFNHLSVCVLHGKYKDQLAAQRHDVYVINYEGLDWLINSGTLAELLRKKWIDVLVFDELTKMKNASKKAMRRKLLTPYLHRFARRWGLTGSPASSGLMNLFGQIGILDMGRCFGPYITHFRFKFFTQISEYKYVMKPGAEDLIYETIKPVALRLELPPSVKLPAFRENDIYIELPPAARRIYDEMEQEMLAILDKEVLSAPTAGAVYGKCCQLASGAVFLSNIDPVTGEPLRNKREWREVHEEKLDAVEDLIDELQGQQLLLAYWYEHDLERLLERLGKDTPYIGAGVSIKKAQAYEAAWNAKELPLLLGHPSSMGHGLNLQYSNARHVGWYTVTPDYELYDQYNRRLRRRGNKANTVTAHRFIAKGTVEAWGNMRALQRKAGEQTDLFNALRIYAKTIKK